MVRKSFYQLPAELVWRKYMVIFHHSLIFMWHNKKNIRNYPSYVSILPVINFPLKQVFQHQQYYCTALMILFYDCHQIIKQYYNVRNKNLSFSWRCWCNRLKHNCRCSAIHSDMLCLWSPIITPNDIHCMFHLPFGIGDRMHQSHMIMLWVPSW